MGGQTSRPAVSAAANAIKKPAAVTPAVTTPAVVEPLVSASTGPPREYAKVTSAPPTEFKSFREISEELRQPDETLIKRMNIMPKLNKVHIGGRGPVEETSVEGLQYRKDELAEQPYVSALATAREKTKDYADKEENGIPQEKVLELLSNKDRQVMGKYVEGMGISGDDLDKIAKYYSKARIILKKDGTKFGVKPSVV